jgi:hypothetical protein
MQLAVSSKGKKGANGSINNIYKAKEEAKETQTGQTYIKKFSRAVDILDKCKEHGTMAPIVLGKELGLISENEGSALEKLLADSRNPAQQLIGNPKNPAEIIKIAKSKDLARVPTELHRIFKLGGYRAGSFVGWICLARVAALVAQKVNSDPKIDFGEAIRSFLNSSAMVQVKCSVSPKGPDAEVRNINVVYPPNFQNKAKMEYNWFSGKGSKGGFSFSLPTT